MTRFLPVPYPGAMTIKSLRVNYTPSVVATGWGLFTWGLSRITFYFLIFATIVLIGTFPWLLLIPLTLMAIYAPFWIARKREQMRLNRERDERHRQRYGRDPLPWRGMPIHTNDPNRRSE